MNIVLETKYLKKTLDLKMDIGYMTHKQHFNFQGFFFFYFLTEILFKFVKDIFLIIHRNRMCKNVFFAYFRPI